MNEFTLFAFSKYIHAIKEAYKKIIRFDDFFSLERTLNSYCLIRHDVDRKPYFALRMAKIEAQAGVQSTYYFRMKRHTFLPSIIKEISNLGHEVGYHYECLSDAKGNKEKAFQLFEQNLLRLREIVSVRTISMHGSPLSSYDNRDMFKDNQERETILKKYNLLGDIYLDIKYQDIAYITDTGRNWSSKANIRDNVYSKVEVDFKNGSALLSYLENSPHRKCVFSVHPERWTDSQFEWIIQASMDTIANTLKVIKKFGRLHK